MVAEIISVGTELLMGQIVNTDAQYICQKLNEIGIDIYHQAVVGDNYDRLMDALKMAASRADIIITTGGLGPTDDDITKECVSKFCNKAMKMNDLIKEQIKVFLSKRGIQYTHNNDKQALFPENSIILNNDFGTALGCIIEHENNAYIVLPGPPGELIPMFDNQVMDYLKHKSTSRFYTSYVQICGVGEAEIEDKLKELIQSQSHPTIATYCNLGFVTVRITAKADTTNEAKRLVDNIEEKVKSIFEKSIYEIGERSISEVVTQYLIDNNITVSVSESCSGGLVSDALVRVSGVSSIYKFGAVTYSNEAKINILGVKPETLNSVGAVSKETAIQMAEGVRQAGRSDIGISTTGIAGPKSDDTNKPVGLVYIALATVEGTVFEELHLHGTRNEIRQMTVIKVFNMIRKYFMDKGELNG